MLHTVTALNGENTGGTATAGPRQERGWTYALAALLVFLLLGLDVLSVLLGAIIDGRSPAEFGGYNTHWYATVGSLLCSVIIWTISTLLLRRWAKRRGALDRLFATIRSRRVFLASLAGIIVLSGIAWLESHSAIPSFISEYRGFERHYPGQALLVTVIQYVYYLLESIMVLWILALWQRAGELWTGLHGVPWGGLGLTLTWGLAHFASHPQGAWVVIASALVLGIVFLVARKSYLATFAVIYSVFLL